MRGSAGAAGRQRVHCDAGAAKILCPNDRRGFKCRFGGPIGRKSIHHHRVGAGLDIDDPSPALPHQLRAMAFAIRNVPFTFMLIALRHAFALIWRGFALPNQDIADVLHSTSSIVYQAVNRTETVNRLVDCVLTLVPLGNVTFESE